MLRQLLLTKPFCYMTQKLTLNLVNQNNISKRGRAIKNVLKLLTIKRTVHNRITLMPSAPELGQESQETCWLSMKRLSFPMCWWLYCFRSFTAFILSSFFNKSRISFTKAQTLFHYIETAPAWEGQQSCLRRTAKGSWESMWAVRDQRLRQRQLKVMNDLTKWLWPTHD